MPTDTCRRRGCDREPLGREAPAGVSSNYCSPECSLTADKRRQEAREARQAAEDRRYG